MNSKLFGVMMFLLVLGFTVVTAIGTSYQPRIYHHLDMSSPLKKGDTVFLFYGGTNDASELMRIGDILPVYRTDKTCQSKETGRIKVTSYVGDYYLKAEVTEGEIIAGDIARKGKASCIVIPVDICSQ